MLSSLVAAAALAPFAAGHASIRHATATVNTFSLGIYPGGAAGTVGPSGPLQPENAGKSLAALEGLRGRGTLFLRLYAEYSGPGSASAAAQLSSAVKRYGAAGFDTEVVLTYRPTDRDPAVDVPGYVGFVRTAVDELGPLPGVTSMQITNEANVGGAPAASDGDFPGAEDALIEGLIAANRQAKADDLPAIKFGFNWAYQQSPQEDSFWTYLRQRGGTPFLQALDWVGVDVYPGTWGPELAASEDLGSAIRAATITTLAGLRRHFMPLAGIPASTPIHVSEGGYPTGPGRTHGMQVIALNALVRTVFEARTAFNVTTFSWFDLRDADSSTPNLQSQYGLLRSNYTAKPAYAAYSKLIARLSR